ncbi:MAG: hypothetical protein QNJ87_14605 [Gammaproteobacteria bacterium]|nr:hypothetical protein [Gammaproteobacteria bacterium]
MINVYDMASGELLHQNKSAAKCAPQRAETVQDDASLARVRERMQWPHPELRLLPVAETERR